jgi:CheY-like chemotaxis protein
MGAFEEFEQSLRDGLTHLYDPTYQIPELLWKELNCDLQQGQDAVQSALIQAIESMKPGPDIPPNARIKRLHEILYQRYVQELTQAEAAQLFGITTRHLRREQQQAIHILAQRLWKQKPSQTSSASPPLHRRKSPENPASKTWRSQLRQELTSLQQSAPGIVANVNDAIQGAAKLGRGLAAKYEVGLKVEEASSTLLATIHPSALRQILIMAIEKVAERAPSGEILLSAEREGEGKQVTVTVNGHPAAGDSPPHSDFIREALATQNATVKAYVANGQIGFQFGFPSAQKVTVLVVDDNADLVHFYRRYTAKTRYQIVHVSEGRHLFEAITGEKPDIIVLDIMLPDIDGWELLTHLYEHPDTKSIPVIVCSVVRQKELASLLGAAYYVTKPVRRKQFIEALDYVINQAPTKV